MELNLMDDVLVQFEHYGENDVFVWLLPSSSSFSEPFKIDDKITRRAGDHETCDGLRLMGWVGGSAILAMVEIIGIGHVLTGSKMLETVFESELVLAWWLFVEIVVLPVVDYRFVVKEFLVSVHDSFE